jgi:hypothetical protein
MITQQTILDMASQVIDNINNVSSDNTNTSARGV